MVLTIAKSDPKMVAIIFLCLSLLNASESYPVQNKKGKVSLLIGMVEATWGVWWGGTLTDQAWVIRPST